MIIRMFDTAVDPQDVDGAKTLFRNEALPAFEAFAGCFGIEMYLATEPAGDLVDVVAVSRWASQEQITEAIASEEYDEALKNLKQLFQRAPIVRHFELVD